MISLISLLEIINVVLPNPKSVADAAVVNPNEIKTLIASGLSTFFIKGSPVFSNGHKCLLKYPSDCTILCN